MEIRLDDMYIPLRFAAELDPTNLDQGTPIAADDLLGQQQPQVVIGGAGTGKTTWMRWTFRRLIQDPRALPFLLELRAIAATWTTPQHAGRPVDGYLADELAACGASDPGSLISALLNDPSGARPVILIDGWDELGVQGERLRERLVELCRAFPRAAVVVSSRPVRSVAVPCTGTNQENTSAPMAAPSACATRRRRAGTLGCQASRSRRCSAAWTAAQGAASIAISR